MRNLENNSYFRPLLTYLGVYSRQRIVDDLDLECAETATDLRECLKISLTTKLCFDGWYSSTRHGNHLYLYL